jgi:hypothetical protein
MRRVTYGLPPKDSPQRRSGSPAISLACCTNASRFTVRPNRRNVPITIARNASSSEPQQSKPMRSPVSTQRRNHAPKMKAMIAFSLPPTLSIDKKRVCPAAV